MPINHKCIALFLFLLLAFVGEAKATYYYESGARFSGMSNAAVAIPDLWSISQNQAGLAYLTDVSAGLHHESRYLVNELGMSALAIAIPREGASLGAQLNYFGYDKYHETKAGLSVAKMFNKRFAVGVQIDYFNTYVYSLPAVNRVTFEAGLMADVTDDVKLGFSVFNPLPAIDVNTQYDKLPTVFRLGSAYTFQEKGILSAEVEHEVNYQTILKAGLEYNLNEQFRARMGLSTGVTQFSFGLGYYVDRLKIDMAFAMQQVLGLTPYFTVSYRLK